MAAIADIIQSLTMIKRFDGKRAGSLPMMLPALFMQDEAGLSSAIGLT
jgi:hypothetical protein